MINLKMKNPLKGKKLVQLVILIGTIAIFSTCEKDADDFGSDVLARQDSIPVLKDTLYNLNTFLEKEPKFITKSTGKLMIGNITNEYFGQTVSSALGEFFLTSAVDSGASVSLEDVQAEVIITYDELFGSEEAMDIQLYKVKEKLDLGENYYSNDNPEDYYNTSEPLISDSINHIREDSTYKIKLTKSFTEKLKNRTFKTVDDTLSFTQAIPGIVFVPQDQTGEGSLMAASISNCNMYLYRTTYPTDSTTVIDTIKYSMNSNFGIRFNMFKHDYTKATAIPSINTSLNSEEEDSLLFIQNLQGTRARINFSDIDKIRAKYEGKLIANASLIFDVKNSYNPQDTTESYMSAFVYNQDSTYNKLNSYMQTIINGQQLQPFEGIYDKTNNEMVFNLTAYYQNLLKGRIEEDIIYLHTANRSTSYNQIVLPGSNSSTPARLEIEYYNTSK
jgi:hypothetical protein